MWTLFCSYLQSLTPPHQSYPIIGVLFPLRSCQLQMFQRMRQQLIRLFGAEFCTRSTTWFACGSHFISVHIWHAKTFGCFDLRNNNSEVAFWTLIMGGLHTQTKKVLIISCHREARKGTSCPGQLWPVFGGTCRVANCLCACRWWLFWAIRQVTDGKTVQTWLYKHGRPCPSSMNRSIRWLRKHHLVHVHCRADTESMVGDVCWMTPWGFGWKSFPHWERSDSIHNSLFCVWKQRDQCFLLQWVRVHVPKQRHKP